MSPDVASAGDTALLEAVSTAPGVELPLSIVVVGVGGTLAHRIVHPVVVGRDPPCDVVLLDPAVSRRHLQITSRASALEVVDLSSRNGTFVDGRRISSARVSAGSVIRVGSSFLVVTRTEEAWQDPDVEGPLVGGLAVAPARRTLGLVGPTELSVMILGETGTGKEVVARLTHALSGRSGPFVAINCAALPEHLVESELFGHVRGAFTGADRARQGLLAQADGGTVFLDELGELPLIAQAKLLRVLEDNLVRPVGAERATRVDLRFVSATNVKLPVAIDEGRFRADLFARLAAVEVRLPALRERREDIPALVAFLAARARVGPLRLSPDALEAMLIHGWPHNIRELDNVVRAVALRGTSVELHALPSDLQARLRVARAGSVMAPSPLVKEMVDVRERVIDALRAEGGNVRRAADSLGMGRGHLYRILKRLALEPSAFRDAGADAAREEG